VWKKKLRRLWCERRSCGGHGVEEEDVEAFRGVEEENTEIVVWKKKTRKP